MSAEVPALEVPGLRLRSAVAADCPFLRALYRSVRDPELALTGWPEHEKQAFADAQFALQDRHYRGQYPGAAFLIVEREGVPIGRVYVGLAPGPLRLMDIALVPGARGRGVGTALLLWVNAWADCEGRDVLVHVEADNPARRLYRRLGFDDDGVEGLYVRMRRKAVTAD